MAEELTDKILDEKIQEANEREPFVGEKYANLDEKGRLIFQLSLRKIVKARKLLPEDFKVCWGVKNEYPRIKYLSVYDYQPNEPYYKRIRLELDSNNRVNVSEIFPDKNQKEIVWIGHGSHMDIYLKKDWEKIKRGTIKPHCLKQPL